MIVASGCSCSGFLVKAENVSAFSKRESNDRAVTTSLSISVSSDTHCENTIYEGELLKNNGLIEKIYTTDTILTNLESPKIELVERFR